MERREALEAAFDKMEAEDKDEVVEAPVKEVQPDEGQQTDELQGEKAELDAKGGEKADKQPDKPEAPSKEAKPDDELARARKAAEATNTTDVKPPVSWKPTAKAAWKDLPLDIKNEVLRREKEMSQFVSQNDHHKKFNEAFARTVQPFQHLIQAQNSTPLQAVRNLMSTAAGLAQGNKQQKASIVAEIIQNYGVDVESLDLILSGRANQIKPGGDDVSPRMMQMLQPVYGFMNEIQQAKQAYEQRQQEEAEQLVNSFDAPYYDDLRDDMADILEVAARRGIKMTIEQAYEKAVALNPEVSEIIAREKIAEQARVAGTRLAKAKRTASTIVGGPAGAPDGKAAPKSRREQIEAAWDDATQH